MGFWHTGYIEFHEPAGLGKSFSPRPTRYRCQHCDGVFNSADALRLHRFEKHPYVRPVLFVRGIELGNTPFRVAQRVIPGDFVAGRCSGAVVNGQHVAPEELGQRLAAFSNDRVQVDLSNEGVRASFEIVFSIAKEPDVIGVENCFLDVARGRRLDVRAIEGFIAAAKRYETAVSYCDGICQYFYGVLAKERATGISLAYADYQDKFSQAADSLSDFDRPLARVIRALVAFHFNHFKDAAALVPNGMLGAASHRFVLWLNGDTTGADQILSKKPDATLEDLLSDFETFRILRWTMSNVEDLSREVEDVKALVQRDISEYDRAKLRILLAEYLARERDFANARRAARELMNNPTMAPWAERLIGRLAVMEQAHD